MALVQTWRWISECNIWGIWPACFPAVGSLQDAFSCSPHCTKLMSKIPKYYGLLWMSSLTSSGCYHLVQTHNSDSSPPATLCPSGKGGQLWVKGGAYWRHCELDQQSPGYLPFNILQSLTKGTKSSYWVDSPRRKPSVPSVLSTQTKGECPPRQAHSAMPGRPGSRFSWTSFWWPVCVGPQLSQLSEPSQQPGRQVYLTYSLVIVLLSSELQIDPSQLCHLVINPYDLGQLLNSISLNFLACKPGVMGPISREANSDQRALYT